MPKFLPTCARPSIPMCPTYSLPVQLCSFVSLCHIVCSSFWYSLVTVHRLWIVINCSSSTKRNPHSCECCLSMCILTHVTCILCSYNCKGFVWLMMVRVRVGAAVSKAASCLTVRTSASLSLFSGTSQQPLFGSLLKRKSGD